MHKKHSFEMKNISIEFPGVKALTNVDFSVESGSIHALIGANGAGKSTLMKSKRSGGANSTEPIKTAILRQNIPL